MRVVVFGLIVAAAFASRVASAQQIDLGALTATRADSLRVALGALSSDTPAFAIGAIRQLEDSTGRRRHVREGLVYGATGGAALGALVGAVAYKPCHSTGLLSCY